jgi:hypothetical protein
MTEISNITNDFNINIELDTDYKDYYYYPSNETKIEIRYKKTEQGIERTRKVFRLEFYPASIAKKIKERQQWEKFGLAKDSNELTTTKTDEVEFEFNPDLKFVKKPPNYCFDQPKIIPKIDFLLNTKYYIENSENNINSQIISEISNNYTNTNYVKADNTDYEKSDYEKSDYETKKDNSNPIDIAKPDIIKRDIKSENDNKKSIVNCRHCNSSEHWSIKCPMLEFERRQKEDAEENQKKQEDQKKQDDFYKEKREKESLIGIKVSDFDTDFSEQQLKDHFKQFGNIHHFYNVKNKRTGNPSGTIYITYSTQEENDRALIEIPRKNIGYIFPSVEIARPKKY